MPRSSTAFIRTATVPETGELGAGEVIDTVGGDDSGVLQPLKMLKANNSKPNPQNLQIVFEHSFLF